MSFLITRTSRYGKKIAKFATGLPKKLPKTKKKTSKSELIGIGLGAGLAAGGIYAYSKTPLAQQTQNQIIEMQKIHKEITLLRDQQINDLNLLLKEEMGNDYAEWWILGGVVVGIVVAVSENFRAWGKV